MKTTTQSFLKQGLLLAGIFMLLSPATAEAHDVKPLKRTHNPELLKKTLDHSFRERDDVNRNYRKNEVVARPDEPVLEDPAIMLEIGDELGSHGVKLQKLREAKKRAKPVQHRHAQLSDD